jgi:hypothetical protein
MIDRGEPLAITPFVAIGDDIADAAASGSDIPLGVAAAVAVAGVAVDVSTFLESAITFLCILGGIKGRRKGGRASLLVLAIFQKQ